jgi:hypothetical protein
VHWHRQHPVLLLLQLLMLAHAHVSARCQTTAVVLPAGCAGLQVLPLLLLLLLLLLGVVQNAQQALQVLLLQVLLQQQACWA